jgi:hypothetical protein
VILSAVPAPQAPPIQAMERLEVTANPICIQRQIPPVVWLCQLLERTEKRRGIAYRSQGTRRVTQRIVGTAISGLSEGRAQQA